MQTTSETDNNYSSSNTSTGTIYGIHGGLWGVNHNVLISIPSGYTANPSAGCMYYDTARTQIKCTDTTGPFAAY